MTRLKALITALCIVQSAFCQDRICIGWNIAETARNGNAEIKIGYAFSSHWSAEGYSSFRILPPSEGVCSSGKEVSGYGLAFRYWPDGHFKGGSISFGITSGFKAQTDMTLSAGYTLAVWKCLYIDIGYGIRVLETIRSDVSDEISIEICVRF